VKAASIAADLHHFLGLAMNISQFLPATVPSEAPAFQESSHRIRPSLGAACAFSLCLSLGLGQAFALSPTARERPERPLPVGATQVLSQVGRLVSVQVTDRATGQSLPIYEHRGEYWVVGVTGNNYAIALQKREGPQRALAVTSVDGINVISGQSAAFMQTGYVLSAYTPYEVTGWRKSLQEVAAFTFAAPGDSYASKTGRAANIGVIGVAVFLEKQERAVPGKAELEKPDVASPRSESSAKPAARTVPVQPTDGAESDRPAEAKSRAKLNDSVAEPASPSGAAESYRAAPAPQASMTPAPLAPGLGTQHGQRETSITRNVSFRRASQSPEEVISIRYDSLDNMVRRGVLAYAQPRYDAPPSPTAFPKSAGFVPDPPRSY
jgi:hypothetical protein